MECRQYLLEGKESAFLCFTYHIESAFWRISFWEVAKPGLDSSPF